MNLQTDLKISIIGAGVSGISCALLLQKMGFNTTVYTRHQQSPLHPDPTFVSLFPSASIIPHSVEHPELESLYSVSQYFFKKLLGLSFPGITTHKHYELYAVEEEVPDYAKQTPEFGILSPKELSKVLHHPSIPTKTGWEFRCFFADWAIYYPSIISNYLSSGGKIIQREINQADLRSLESDILINAAEFGGPELAGDKFNPVIYRGHLLHVKGAPLLKTRNDEIVSYNFTPGADIYSSSDGSPMDVYCYPRGDGWILGGTRQKGTLNENGNWTGEETKDPVIEIDGNLVPKQILDLHSSIIHSSFGVDINDYPDIRSKVGYRFMGNGRAGLRIDTQEIGDKLMINNYGHGGAGVTLSWGCALKVLDLLASETGADTLSHEEVAKYLEA